MIEFHLTFDGNLSGEGLIEFYDVARALAGFQRSLALTAHLALNGEIITQAPSAAGFAIYVEPFEHGSWRTKALMALSAGGVILSAGKDSPMGQIVTSLYDAALYNTMGFHVDYDKTLQQQHHEYFKEKGITEEKIDSLCEKIESSVADIHRPIVASETATRAQISCENMIKPNVGPLLSPITYEYVRKTSRENDITMVRGYVSSYNINTYKGRLFSLDEIRPIPFQLDESVRSKEIIGILTRSQHINGQNRNDPQSMIELACNRIVSANGKTKRYHVIGASSLG